VGPASSPVESAAQAGLVYVTDDKPGITRSGEKPDFTYTDAKGQVVEDEATLNRIRSLVIPPNWTKIWICPNPRGHLQATGRDAKGRKQYRYHPRYRASREETKYRKLELFGKKLPVIRRKVQQHLAKKRPAQGKGSGGGGAADGHCAYPHRQRGVRAAEPILWAHYDAQSPREGEGQ